MQLRAIKPRPHPHSQGSARNTQAATWILKQTLALQPSTLFVIYYRSIINISRENESPAFLCLQKARLEAGNVAARSLGTSRFL